MSLTIEQRTYLEKRLRDERESNATRASRELKEIDAALERLYKSPAEFGRGEDGREIPFERLDMIPWARSCD